MGDFLDEFSPGGLRSCDFTDSGCVDADCDYCYPRMSTRKLTNIAANLAVAAGLCLSYQLNADPRGPIRYGSRQFYNKPWRPGCGRPAPGFEGK